MLSLKSQCQSCGLPLDQDPQGGGSEKDGSRSTTYCSLCYQAGQFVGPDCTVAQMQEIVDRALAARSSSWLMRKIAVMQVPYLARWRQR